MGTKLQRSLWLLLPVLIFYFVNPSRPQDNKPSQSKPANNAKPAKQNDIEKDSKKDSADKKREKSDDKSADKKVDLLWLETFVGEIISMNPVTQRVIIKGIKDGKTKLISLDKETVIKKGNDSGAPSDLKRGQNVMIKYDFLESNARLISILSENANSK